MNHPKIYARFLIQHLPNELEKMTSTLSLARLLQSASLANKSGSDSVIDVPSNLGPVMLPRVDAIAVTNDEENGSSEQFVVFAQCGHCLPIDPLRGPRVNPEIWDDFIRLRLIRTAELIKRTLTWYPMVPTCPLCLFQNKGL
ncbi:hypothetical protein D915_011202 [Fasciola hepatica]|uniref:Uncharacterized protein n=1 Tax=Fasciola hepatica TaxID=6192 RepID=A0A4E0QYE5_FASHE|nr:hypothetical protein D915_011202 [Fasciola hepatica]